MKLTFAANRRISLPVLPFKIWLAMRLTIVFLLFALLQANAKGNAQNITYSGKNVELKKIFKTIKKQTGQCFFYREDDLEMTTPVTIDFKDAPLAVVLKSIFANQRLTYEFIGKTIVVKAKAPQTNNISNNLPLPIVIKGRVANDKNEPLKDVSIIISGTVRGTTTDANGNFSLEVNKGETLIFSIIGYVDQTIVIGNETNISVSLVQQINNLQDVIVVGYGTQKKVTTTGAVAQVKGSVLEKMPTMNLSNALVGRLPGVTAINNNGEPGFDGSKIRIRGTNAFGNSSPLVVIDGVPDRAGGLERINPADVESMSVLKDASVAIFGQRSANGVILVTTKRGKSGKPTILYNANFGISQPVSLVKTMNSIQYGTVRNEIAVYGIPHAKWTEAYKALTTTGVYSYVDAGETKTINSPNGFSPADMKKYADKSDPWGHPDTKWYDAA